MFKLVMALMFFSFSASAEPICFQAEKQVPAYLPETICFDDMTVEVFTSNHFVTVKGGLLAGRYLARIESHDPQGQVGLVFRSNLYNRIDTGCGFGEATDAVVQVLSVQGRIEPKNVALKVETTVINDVCHADPSTLVIPYKLIQ